MIDASRRPIGLPRPASGRSRPKRRAGRWLVAILAAVIAALITTAGAFASTPVTNGYRDFTYGGGAARPTSDKPQSKLWFTDNTWYSVMFYFRTGAAPKAEYRIFKLDEATHSWVVTPTIIDTRDKSHADVLWDETAKELYVVSTHPTKDSANPDDHIKVYRFSYSAATKAYTALGGANIAGTESTATFLGGSWSATIAKAANGDLWVVWISSNTAPGATAGPGRVMYAVSTDDGLHWSDPAQVPVEAANSVRNGTLTSSDVSSVVSYNGRIGVMWSDHDGLPAPSTTSNGYYFASIAPGDDPAVIGNWTLDPKVTNLVADGQQADNHLNVKVASDGTLYAVGKTNKDTINCATNTNLPLIELFKRTIAGTWTAHLVATVGDCQTRPQVVLDEQLDVAYVLLSGPNGGGVGFLKSAPLSGPDALVFRGAADTTIQRGLPFIKSATEVTIDDLTTTKQIVNSTSGLVANANNNLSTAKWYLHNEMPLPAADAAPPTGTTSIAAGAAFTTTATVTVDTPGDDGAGSGLSLVRLANAATVTGGKLSDASAKSFAYSPSVIWTLAAGDGTKTVYVQWRDAAGNWSVPISDTIVLDQTAPTGTLAIDNGAPTASSANVTLDMTTDDGAGSGTVSVLITGCTNFTPTTSVPFAASINCTLPANDHVGPPAVTRTVSVQFVDAVGNTSTAVSDTIDVTQADNIPPGSVGVPLVRFASAVSSGNPIRILWTAATDNSGGSGVAKYLVYRRQGTGAWIKVAEVAAPTTSVNLAFPSGAGWRVYVRAVDNAGNLGPTGITASTFTTSRYLETSSAATYSSGWTTSTSTAYLDGHAKVSTHIGSSVSFRYTGKSVAVAGRRGPTSGRARVYVNNVLAATIDLYSATTLDKQILFQKTYTTSATRVLKIVLIGPSTRPRVTIDGFYVIR